MKSPLLTTKALEARQTAGQKHATRKETYRKRLESEITALVLNEFKLEWSEDSRSLRLTADGFCDIYAGWASEGSGVKPTFSVFSNGGKEVFDNFPDALAYAEIV